MTSATGNGCIDNTDDVNRVRRRLLGDNLSVIETQLKNLVEEKLRRNKLLEEANQQIQGLKQELESAKHDKAIQNELIDYLRKENAEMCAKLAATSGNEEGKQTCDRLEKIGMKLLELERKEIDRQNKFKVTQEELINLKEEQRQFNEIISKLMRRFDPQLPAISSMSENNPSKNLERFGQLCRKRLEYYGTGIMGLGQFFSSICRGEVLEEQQFSNVNAPWLTPYVHSSFTEGSNQTETSHFHFLTSRGLQNNEEGHDETAPMECDDDNLSKVTPRASSTKTLSTLEKMKVKKVTANSWKVVSPFSKNCNGPTPHTSGRWETKFSDSDEEVNLLKCTYTTRKRKKPCKDVFRTHDALNLHLVTKHKKISNALRCTMCGKLVPTSKALLNHKKNFHSNAVPASMVPC